jgi:hypothetical protein
VLDTMNSGHANTGDQRKRSLVQLLSPPLISNEHSDLVSVSGFGFHGFSGEEMSSLIPSAALRHSQDFLRTSFKKQRFR